MFGRGSRGVALLSMMLVLAIVTVVTTRMVLQNRTEIKRADTLFKDAQASEYVYSGLALAELWLQRDVRKDQSLQQATDHYFEPWAKDRPPFKPDGGYLLLDVVDEMGKFNLNNLINDDGHLDAAQFQVFQTLLTGLAVDQDVAKAVVDWLDADISSLGYNSEDIGYLQLTPAYRTANAAIAHPSELRLIKGVTEEVLDLLLPHVTALPSKTAVNINTATENVLEAILPGSSGLQIIQMREQLETGFKSVDLFLQHQITAGTKNPVVDLSVNSTYFRVVAQAIFHGHQSGWQFLLHRNSESGQTRQLWREQLPFWMLDHSLESLMIDSLATESVSEENKAIKP